jgi:hypothetical protein
MTRTNPQTPWSHLIRVGAGLAAAVTLLALAFLWPNATSKAQDLPIALVGPPAATAQLEQALEQLAPGVFDVVDATDRAAAVDLIETREVYGAIVLGEEPVILTTTAGSSAVAQQLAALAPVLAHQVGVPAVPVTDVVPLAAGDPRGAVLGLVTLPLVIGGMFGGIAISLSVVGVWRRITAVAVYSLIGGLGVAAVLQAGFGALQGAYLVNTTIIALTFAAVSVVIVGTVSIVGRPGIAVGPVLFLLVAQPIASAAAPWQMLPAPFGAIGQAMPPGAAATLLRNHAYFPAASTAGLWLTLVAWVVLGLALAMVGHFRDTGAATRAAVEEAQDAEVGSFS